MRTCIRPVFSKAAGSEILQRYSGIAVRTILPALTMTLSISASKACDVVIYNTRERDPGHCAYNPRERDNPPRVFYGRSQFGQYRAVEFTCGFNRARSAFGNSFSIGCGSPSGVNQLETNAALKMSPFQGGTYFCGTLIRVVFQRRKYFLRGGDNEN
jgi:hypothetical protein